MDSILSGRDGAGDMKAFVDGRAAAASAAVEHRHLHLIVCLEVIVPIVLLLIQAGQIICEMKSNFFFSWMKRGLLAIVAE